MPPAFGFLIEDHDFVAERRKIRALPSAMQVGTDAGHALAVLLRRRFRQLRADIALFVGGDALETADRYSSGLA